MGVDVDRPGGNLLGGFVALILWIIASTIIRILLTPAISSTWAGILGIVLGFVVVSGGYSYWYYRQQSIGE